MSFQFSKVSIIGLGYIGLPTAAVLASHGVEVVGVDTNPAVIDTVNRGGTHFAEPDLEALLQTEVSSGSLRATDKVEPSQAFILAVPTPLGQNHQPDLSFVRAAAQSIAPVLQKDNLVILESTSPAGTTERLAEWLAEARPDLSFPTQSTGDPDIHVAFCPERVLPGRILRELVANDRIVAGLTARCAVRAVALYKIFVQGECLVTTARTAELAKLAENSFRDVNIALANEFSLICEKLGVNVWELIELANRHPRVNILQPGPGVGGHCIAVDPWFIVDSAPEEARLIRVAREINDAKPDHVVRKVKQAAAAFKEPVIACLGLSYKADVDDLRESPATGIVKILAEAGIGKILAVEPHIDRLPSSLAEVGVGLTDLESAIRDADVIVLLVNHRVFQQVDRRLLAQKTVVDTRGMWG